MIHAIYNKYVPGILNRDVYVKLEDKILEGETKEAVFKQLRDIEMYTIYNKEYYKFVDEELQKEYKVWKSGTYMVHNGLDWKWYKRNKQN